MDCKDASNNEKLNRRYDLRSSSVKIHGYLRSSSSRSEHMDGRHDVRSSNLKNGCDVATNSDNMKAVDHIDRMRHENVHWRYDLRSATFKSASDVPSSSCKRKLNRHDGRNDEDMNRNNVVRSPTVQSSSIQQKWITKSKYNITRGYKNKKRTEATLNFGSRDNTDVPPLNNPPGFKNVTPKYEYHVTAHQMGHFLSDACYACGKPRGPCMPMKRDKQFFSLPIVSSRREFLVNKMGEDRINIEDMYQRNYKVKLVKASAMTFLCGSGWQEFFITHDIDDGDRLCFHFKEDLMTMVAFVYRDKLVWRDGKKVVVTNEVQPTYMKGLVRSFKMEMSSTDINCMLTLNNSITEELCLPREGEVTLINRRGDV
uniref:TF-B3 domain-containing protein n=1 Tax=Triticum urartu TaxID=4572 RepID=A0A8R7UKK9_TRIUA